jgi:recombination associated protein RdgC
VSLVHTEMSPAVAMTHWLGTGEAPYAFSIDRECELKSADEMKSVVRYARHPLDTDEVKQHILTGKVPTRVAMTWRDRVSFILTESMQLKKLAFLDVVFEGASAAAGKVDKGEAFDADAAIATGELIQMIPDLLEALGGEQLIGQAPAMPVPAPAPMDPHPAADHAPPWDA